VQKDGGDFCIINRHFVKVLYAAPGGSNVPGTVAGNATGAFRLRQLYPVFELLCSAGFGGYHPPHRCQLARKILTPCRICYSLHQMQALPVRFSSGEYSRAQMSPSLPFQWRFESLLGSMHG
jgi:hypothetical protein